MKLRLCFLLALLFGWGHGLSADILYSVTDLTTVLGNSVLVQQINNAGQILGSNYGVNGQPFVYTAGQITYFGGGFGPSGMNDVGQFVGSANGHAAVYSNGQITDLGTLPGSSFSSGGAINNVGEVTGFSTLSGQSFHAFIYRNGQMTDIGTLGGINFSSGSAINDLGEVAGTGYGTYAFVYSNGQMINLTLGGTGYGNAANAINNDGQVTGYSSTPSGSTHAFLYSNGQMLDLGSLGGKNSAGADINNNGQVVGAADVISPQPMYFSADAFLYSQGEMMDLNDLIDPALGIRLYRANSINDHGQILADGAPSSEPCCGVRPYLLTPVPEPSTFALVGVAVVGLCVWLRRCTSVFH